VIGTYSDVVRVAAAKRNTIPPDSERAYMLTINEVRIIGKGVFNGETFDAYPHYLYLLVEPCSPIERKQNSNYDNDTCQCKCISNPA